MGIIDESHNVCYLQRLVKLTTATSKWGPRGEKVANKTETTLVGEIADEGSPEEIGRRKVTAICFENPAFEDKSSDERFGSLTFINKA